MATDDLIGMNSIVYDQYGRILDGNQRQRVARLRGLAVPFTIMQVRDDAHAIDIARAANAVRRHYTPEQRQELAPILRDQGFRIEPSRMRSVSGNRPSIGMSSGNCVYALNPKLSQRLSQTGQLNHHSRKHLSQMRHLNP